MLACMVNTESITSILYITVSKVSSSDNFSFEI